MKNKNRLTLTRFFCHPSFWWLVLTTLLLAPLAALRAADTHGDHRAAFWYARDAVRTANFQGDFFTCAVHGAPPPQPPDRRLVLSKMQVETKRTALIDHQQGTSPVHDRLADEYMKPEESFWKVRLAPDASK